MTRPPHNAVYDCVIFAQALINPSGPAAECVDQARGGRVRLYVSPYVLDEIRELPPKILAKYAVTQDQAAELADEIVTFATVVTDAPTIYTHPHDPHDSHYIDLAVATHSKLIVSRDRHLLNLMDQQRPEAREFRRRFPDLIVLPPDTFARQLRQEASEDAAP
jgi:putative PIN family toxin of toxin-antitoxin system